MPQSLLACDCRRRRRCRCAADADAAVAKRRLTGRDNGRGELSPTTTAYQRCVRDRRDRRRDPFVRGARDPRNNGNNAAARRSSARAAART